MLTWRYVSILPQPLPLASCFDGVDHYAQATLDVATDEAAGYCT